MHLSLIRRNVRESTTKARAVQEAFLTVFWYLLLLGCATQLSAQGAAPVLLYSDLDSGPATSGQNGNGVFVCVYGENFGSSGTLTIGGAMATLNLWTQSRSALRSGTLRQGLRADCFQCNIGSGHYPTYHHGWLQQRTAIHNPHR